MDSQPLTGPPWAYPVALLLSAVMAGRHRAQRPEHSVTDTIQYHGVI